MDSVVSQLQSQPWFCALSDRSDIERLLSSKSVPNGSFVVRPCANQRQLALSYKSVRGELVHSRISLAGGEWRLDDTERTFPTVNKLVQSITRLKALPRCGF